MKYYLLTFIIIGIYTETLSQINGVVKDQHDEEIPGVTVLVTSTNTGASTNVDGYFEISGLDGGNYTLQFSSVGFKTIKKDISYNGKQTTVNVTLSESVSELKEVLVVANSETAELRQMPYSISVIDVAPLKLQNLDINQILNTTTGVRIREDGGLGSNFNFTLNGFSGSQVKFFIDGIPMDNFGSSLTLNNIPVNLISDVEVYKGVVPVQLGSDALGGAVNIKTNQSIRNYLNLSYSIGSFNTHRASLASRVTSKSGLILNTNAFFNYSDNNYEVEVQIPDPKSGKIGDPQEVERFHDGYQSQTIQLEAGIENKRFADRLLIGVIGSGNEKEIQTGSNMTKVVGEALTSDKAFISTLKYLKNNLITENLNFRLNAVYNTREAMVVDTVSKIYDWNGNFTYRGIDVRSGEISWDKTQFRFNDQSFLSTANLSFQINEQQHLAFNQTYSRYTRVGEDPISYNAVPFSEPNTLSKGISGLSYNLNLFDAKLRIITFGKLFLFDAVTRDGDGYGDDQTLEKIEVSEKHWGFGAAATYFFLPDLQFKTSFENTYRLPEAYEMFGDGLLVQHNPYLSAEKSNNLNVGFLGNYITSKHSLKYEANYLFRTPENLIRSVATGILSQYENLSSAIANIYEARVKYRYNSLLDFEVNGTYQSIRNNEKFTPTGGENYLYRDRVPNMPFLFGNAKAGFTIKDLGGQSNILSLNWSTLFVEAFYLKWPSQGSRSTKYDIPRQLSHNLVASYSIRKGTYNVSLACTNILDNKVFDNFMLQKPGRAFNLKVSYFLK